LGVPGGNQPAV